MEQQMDLDKQIARVLGGAPADKPDVLLAELDEVIRHRPSPREISERPDEAAEWIGRASAVLQRWKHGVSIQLVSVRSNLHSNYPNYVAQGHAEMLALLHEAMHDLRIASGRTVNVAVDGGRVFEYFEGVRKIIERATADLLFVDAYLDADFVARYLPFAQAGVRLRLLAGPLKLNTLVPAVEAFVKQSSAVLELRATDKIHDRYVFVDRKECYQSGASFKDGAAKAPTTLTQIIDVFDDVLAGYEKIWGAAKPIR